MSPALRRLAEPRPARVRPVGAPGEGGRAGVGVERPPGCPAVIDGERVEALVQTWLVEDRWWTERPIRRRYWEVVTEGGRAVVVHRDLLDGRWWRLR